MKGHQQPVIDELAMVNTVVFSKRLRVKDVSATVIVPPNLETIEVTLLRGFTGCIFRVQRKTLGHLFLLLLLADSVSFLAMLGAAVDQDLASGCNRNLHHLAVAVISDKHIAVAIHSYTVE